MLQGREKQFTQKRWPMVTLPEHRGYYAINPSLVLLLYINQSLSRHMLARGNLDIA